MDYFKDKNKAVLTEKYYPFSPYHYGAGNPLRYIDVDGQKLYMEILKQVQKLNMHMT